MNIMKSHLEAGQLSAPLKKQGGRDYGYSFLIFEFFTLGCISSPRAETFSLLVACSFELDMLMTEDGSFLYVGCAFYLSITAPPNNRSHVFSFLFFKKN